MSALCLRVAISYVPRLNWSLLRAGVPLVWRLSVENRRETPAAGCALRLVVPDFLDSGPIVLRELAPGETQVFDGERLPWVRRDFARAARLANEQETHLRLSLTEHPGELAAIGSGAALCPLTLLRADEWCPGLCYDAGRAAFVLDPLVELAEATIEFPAGGSALTSRTDSVWNGQPPLPAAVAALLFGEHSGVELIKGEAMRSLGDMLGDPRASLDDAVRGTVDERRAVVQSLFMALHRVYPKVLHDVERLSLERRSQRIRLPDAMGRGATCVDFSLLLCSALAACGLRALFVLIAGDAGVGHALVACRLDDGDPDTALLLTDAASLLSQVDAGKLLLVDVTEFARGRGFPAACRRGQEQIAAPGALCYAVDLGVAADPGRCAIKPLPWPAPVAEPAPAPAAVLPLAVAAIPPPANPPASGWDRLKTRLFDGHYTRRYRRSVEAEYAKFTLLGVKHLALEKIYVGLQVGDYAPRDLLPDGAAARADDSSGFVPPTGTPVDVPTALSLSPSLLVLGDPGSGKTTLLRYLALKLARRDPLLAEFARARIPRRGALLLERICRGLSGANVVTVFIVGLFSSMAVLIAWSREAFRSPTPTPAFDVLALILLFGGLLLLLFRRSPRTIAMVSLAVGSVLVWAGWLQPDLVGRGLVADAAVAFAILLFPYWVRPLLAILRAWLQRATRYPLPVYLTLNNATGDGRPLTAHLAETLAGVPAAQRFLARKLERGECVLLLDALDEVVEPGAHRRVLDEIARLKKAYGTRNEIVVSSRIAGYRHTLDGYLPLEVQPFDSGQVRHFVEAWFTAGDSAAAAPAGGRAAGLLQALERNPRMAALAANPLLVSLISLLYEKDWRLPEQRVDLYEQCVTLLSEIWDQRRGVERVARFTPAQKRCLLTALAAHLQRSGTRVFEGGELFAVLDDLAPPAGVAAADARALVDEILAHSGLLRRKSRSAYDFVHLSFQEYFAARDFLARGVGDELLAHIGEAWWREVIRLYAAMAPQAPQLLAALRNADLLLAAGCLADARDSGTSDFAACANGIVGDLVRPLHGEAPGRQAAADALAEVGRWGANEALRAAFADADRPGLALPVLLALARGGDPATLQGMLANHGRVLRLLHGELPGAAGGVRTRILALLERLGQPLVYVPAGDFWMGSDDGPAIERPRHRVTLAEYWIDRNPVTNAQYAAFVEATGYRAQGSWRDEFGAGKERHPVVLVTWGDACAYAEWCGKRLPSEAQWEKAARGSDGRTWPWGNVWDLNRCNVSAFGTTAVGSYPQGVSPYGCHDLAGNVAEWVADWYDAGYYARSAATDPRGPDTGDYRYRVLRGGSWSRDGWGVRSTDRIGGGLGHRGRFIGFRLALGHQGLAEPAPGAPPSVPDGGQAGFRTIRATGAGL